jgi:hypothetical protein
MTAINSYKILSSILFSWLVPYINEITGDYQCGFRRNRLTTDQIFCIRQILEKEWEYNETVHQLFIAFKKAYDSVRREVLYNILTEFGVPMKLVRLIKMCLHETYSKVRIGKNLTGGWRKLHNEELHNLYHSPSVIRIVKPRRMRWEEHIARRGRRGTTQPVASRQMLSSIESVSQSVRF